MKLKIISNTHKISGIISIIIIAISFFVFLPGCTNNANDKEVNKNDTTINDTVIKNPKVQSCYAPVNGLSMYYELHGTGQPLVLLHGAYSGIGTSFGKLLPALAKTRQVIAGGNRECTKHW